MDDVFGNKVLFIVTDIITYYGKELRQTDTQSVLCGSGGIYTFF